MRHRTKHKTHLSKTAKSEILIARLSLPVLLVFLFLIEISLGTRSPNETKGFLKKNIHSAAETLRQWEAASSDAKKTSKSDARSNAGFHLQWPLSAFAPEIEILKNSQSRIEKIKDAIQLGKSKLQAQFDLNSNELIWLEEPLNSTGSVFLRKKVEVLLPGEKITLKGYRQSTSTKSWTLRVRAAAVTQDRLDAPLPLMTEFGEEQASRSDIDPHGQHFDIILPTASELQKNKASAFTIEWPSTNSGLLIIDGLKPESLSAQGVEKNHKNLIIHIDQLGTSLAGLKKTLATIKSLSSERQGTILLSNAIPPSVDDEISKESLLSNKHPIDLGSTLTNPALQELISREYLLVKRAIQNGGSARKIVLNSGMACSTECKNVKLTTSNSLEFTTAMVIHRIEEFESTKRYIRNDEFITQPGLLYVEVNNPPETLRLNSETNRSSQTSAVSWIVSGLLKPLGYMNPSLQFEEKTAQLDNWLSKLMESFLVTSDSANIAIVLHDNSQPLTLGKGQVSNSLTRGEILLHLNELSTSSSQKDEIQTFDEPVSALAVMRIFGKRAFLSQSISGIEEFLPELKDESIAVNQLQPNQLITLAPSGWLIDPVFSEKAASGDYLAIAAPEKIHAIQELSNKARQRNRLMSLNITFDASNQTDETVEAVMTTSLTPLGCESPNDEIQAKETTSAQNNSQRQFTFTGKREKATVWRLRCLLDGRIVTSSNLKLRFALNNRAVSRDAFGLGEYLHPVRGFLWHSPDSLELSGAQILDATSALNAPELTENSQARVRVWTDRFPTSVSKPETLLTFSDKSDVMAQETSGSLRINDKFSERK